MCVCVWCVCRIIFSDLTTEAQPLVQRTERYFNHPQAPRTPLRRPQEGASASSSALIFSYTASNTRLRIHPVLLAVLRVGQRGDRFFIASNVYAISIFDSSTFSHLPRAGRSSSAVAHHWSDLPIAIFGKRNTIAGGGNTYIC